MKSSLCKHVDENCVDVEVVEPWRKSSFTLWECVEVRPGKKIQVRDSKLGEISPVLEFTPDEWVAFTKGVKNNEFDFL